MAGYYRKSASGRDAARHSFCGCFTHRLPTDLGLSSRGAGYFGPHWRSQYDTRIWTGKYSEQSPLSLVSGQLFGYIPVESDVNSLTVSDSIVGLDYVYLFHPNGK